MVPWWKKIGISMVSWAAGAILGAAIMVLQMLITDPPPISRMGESLLALASLAPVFLALSFTGWLIAIPLVLLVKGFCRWRFWVYLGLGTCIGPALWLLSRILTEKGDARFDLAAMPYQAIVVPFLAALVYILLFRRAQARLSATSAKPLPERMAA